MCAEAKRPRSSLASGPPDRSHRRIDRVVMPVASVGFCQVRRCHVGGDLADGLCVRHWDAGLDTRKRRADPVE